MEHYKPKNAMAKTCNGCQPDEELATFILKKIQRSRIGDIAYWERKKKRDLAQEAFNDLMEKYKHVPERGKA